MPYFLARCSKGLGDVAAYELSLYGIKPSYASDSFVFFESEVSKVIELIGRLRVVEDVYQSEEDPETFIKDIALPDRFTRLKRINGKPLYLRDYRVFNHPSALLPTVAAGLLLSTDMSRDIVDPFAGGGTILIEDAIMMHGSMQKTMPYNSKFHKILGIEINPAHISGARKNVRKAGVEDFVNLMLGDSTRVEIDDKFERMVTNPPFGIKGSKRQRIIKLYERFAGKLDSLLKSNAEGVIITTEWRYMSKVLNERGIKVKNVRKIMHSKLYTGAIYFRL